MYRKGRLDPEVIALYAFGVKRVLEGEVDTRMEWQPPGNWIGGLHGKIVSSFQLSYALSEKDLSRQYFFLGKKYHSVDEEQQNARHGR